MKKYYNIRVLNNLLEQKLKHRFITDDKPLYDRWSTDDEFFWGGEAGKKLANHVNLLSFHYMYLYDFDFGSYIDVGAQQCNEIFFELFDECHLFEPNPIYTSELQQGTKQFNNVNIYEIALTNQEKKATLYLGDYNIATLNKQYADRYDDNFFKHEITVSTNILDNYDLKIDFLKIDTDGVDGEVIIGGEKTIAREKPLIFVEDFLDKTTVEHECLFDNGYVEISGKTSSNKFYVHRERL